MVVLGAGASADSANFKPNLVVEQFRPPMGRDLFADRDHLSGYIDGYEDVRSIVHRFRGAEDSVSLEAGLEDIQRRSANRELLRRQLIALRYYLQRVIVHSTREWSNRIRGVTNYVAMVHELDELWVDARKTPVLYVTFNYDTMLDGALGQLGVRFGPDLQTYLAHPRHRLFKPHGSVNWFHPVSGLNLAQHSYYRQIVEKYDFLTISPDFVVDSEHKDIDDLAAIPALSIPVATKSVFEMPASHVEALRSSIPNVTHLLVIGWRGNEANFRSMLEALDRRRLRSLVITRSSASAAKVATTLNLPTEAPSVSGHTFSSFLGSDQLAKFLAS